MFKGIKLYLLGVIGILIASCSCKNSTDERRYEDSIQAELLLAEAINAFNENLPLKALFLIDSIDSSFIEQISVRRKAMSLKPMVKEVLIMKEIQRCDSLLVTYEIQQAPAVEIYKVRVNKEKFERQLQVARNQIARMSDSGII